LLEVAEDHARGGGYLDGSDLTVIRDTASPMRREHLRGRPPGSVTRGERRLRGDQNGAKLGPVMKHVGLPLATTRKIVRCA
jgi:hypothetical protein